MVLFAFRFSLFAFRFSLFWLYKFEKQFFQTLHFLFQKIYIPFQIRYLFRAPKQMTMPKTVTEIVLLNFYM